MTSDDEFLVFWRRSSLGWLATMCTPEAIANFHGTIVHCQNLVSKGVIK